MAESFKAGDVVQLASGGPLMTVEKPLNDGRLYCVWFDKTEAKTGTYAATSLRAPAPPPKPFVV